MIKAISDGDNSQEEEDGGEHRRAKKMGHDSENQDDSCGSSSSSYRDSQPKRAVSQSSFKDHMSQKSPRNKNHHHT